MPELPEVEIVKKSLFKMINKAKIIDIKINNKNLRYKIPNVFLAKSLIGEKILKISRRSKYLIFHFKNKYTFSSFGYDWKNITPDAKIIRNYLKQVFIMI